MSFDESCYNPNVEMLSQLLLWMVMTLIYFSYQKMIIDKHKSKVKNQIRNFIRYINWLTVFNLVAYFLSTIMNYLHSKDF